MKQKICISIGESELKTVDEICKITSLTRSSVINMILAKYGSYENIDNYNARTSTNINR